MVWRYIRRKMKPWNVTLALDVVAAIPKDSVVHRPQRKNTLTENELRQHIKFYWHLKENQSTYLDPIVQTELYDVWLPYPLSILTNFNWNTQNHFQTPRKSFGYSIKPSGGSKNKRLEPVIEEAVEEKVNVVLDIEASPTDVEALGLDDSPNFVYESD